MAKEIIRGSVFITIGIAVMLMSLFIDLKNGENKLTFFVLAGAVIIVIGFLKIISREKKSAPHHAHHAEKSHQHAAQHQSHHRATPNKPHVSHHHTAESHITPKMKSHHTQVIRCAGCGVKLHPLFKFCPNCGHKMK